MQGLSINNEIGLMCRGVARGHRGGRGGERMDGGTRYKDGCGGERRVRGTGEIDVWTAKG